MGKSTNDNVKVMVRVRPFNQKEINEVGGIPICTLRAHSTTVISCIHPDGNQDEHNFPFDFVFWSMPPDQVPAPIGVPFADQPDLFDHIACPQLDSSFEGYNGCVFAYGQTSSGKTHSMMGYPGAGAGITPRLCEALFGRIADSEAASASLTHSQGGIKKINYSVTVSFLEIYNEKVLDLLGGKKSGHANDKALPIVQDPKNGPTVKGLSIVTVKSWEDVERQFDAGQENRSVAATAMNDRSSRSHAVVQLTVTMVEVIGQVGGKMLSKERRSRINLVDLAGSEKIGKSKVEGANLKEAIGINQSLTCLGRVIDGLVKGDTHVPYRDSVLTQLLADSLGGNSRTCMLAALSPAAVNYEETLSTLRYASRARKIVNKVKINEDPAAAMIRELQEQLARMKENILAGNVDALQAELGGDGEVPVQGLVQQRAAEAEKMIEELKCREREAEIQVQQKEQEWQSAREELEEHHQMELQEVEEKQQELIRQHSSLVKRADVMQEQIVEQRKVGLGQKFAFAARIGAAKAEKEKVQDASKELRRKLIVNRFRTASQQAQHEEATKMLKDEHDDDRARLEDMLAAAQAEIAALQAGGAVAGGGMGGMGMQGGQMGQPMAGVVPLVPEDLEYEGPVCDVCLEQPAQFRCMEEGCDGDVFCVWCDANQHRSGKYKEHIRRPIVAPCECCNVREAILECPEWNNARLCQQCYEKKAADGSRRAIIKAPCEFCGLREADTMCLDCPARLCQACDELRHRGPRRAGHRRRAAVFLNDEDPLSFEDKPAPAETEYIKSLVEEGHAAEYEYTPGAPVQPSQGTFVMEERTSRTEVLTGGRRPTKTLVQRVPLDPKLANPDPTYISAPTHVAPTYTPSVVSVARAAPMYPTVDVPVAPSYVGSTYVAASPGYVPNVVPAPAMGGYTTQSVGRYQPLVQRY